MFQVGTMRPQVSLAVSNANSLEGPTDKRVPAVGLSGSQRHIVRAVHCAWTATLPSTPFEIDKSWSDIGIDSLKALEFVIRLERLLGIRVSFDAMTPECTVFDLIRLLADNQAAHRETLRRVFLIPGILGDEPKLASFRRAFRQEAAFETLELPDIDAPINILISIGATAAMLADRVIEIQPDGDILLAGYSFGGIVAQDMARQLEAAGRKVRFLAVLDGPLGRTTPQRSLSTNAASLIANRMAAIRSILRRLVLVRSKLRTRAGLDRQIFNVLMRLGAWDLMRLAAWDMARRFLLRAAPRHDPMWLSDRRWGFLLTVRSWAVLRWRPAALSTSTLLIKSNENVASVEAWQSICPALRVTTIDAGHEQMFEPETVAVVRRAFLEHLARIGDQGPHE
jgi:thioesterase domain-containing protein/acyl carrier protein